MHDAQEILNSAPKIVSALVVAIVALTDISKGLLERFGIRPGCAKIIAVFLLIGIILIAPSHFPSQCEHRIDYRWKCGVFLTLGAVFLIPAVLIYRRYSYTYTQYLPETRSEKTHTMIGGRALRPEALMLRKSGLDEQTIFKKLEFKSDRMWVRDLAHDMQLPYDIFSTLCAASLVMAMVCGASWLALEVYANTKHVPLDLITPNKKYVIDVQSKLEIELDSTVSRCEPPPHWNVEADNGEPRQADVIGQKIDRSRTGIWYKPPQTIREETTVRLTVFTDSPKDFKSILIHLQRSPEYVHRLADSTPVPGSADMRLEALILNADYAFEFGEYTLKNADMDAAIHTWSNDGLFGDFDIVVVVGAASRKHTYTTDEQERERSRQRAAIIAALVKSELNGSDKTVWGLNVGRFQSEESELDSDMERQVVIIGIKGHYSRDQVLSGLRTTVRENKRHHDIFTRYNRWYDPNRWELVDPQNLFPAAKPNVRRNSSTR